MQTRIVTKIGDVFETKDGRLLQLVAIDYFQLNSDVLVVYAKSKKRDPGMAHSLPIDFYQHSTASLGVRQGLWTKVGRAPLPDISKLVFKTYRNTEVNRADRLTATGARKLLHKLSKPHPNWYVWTPLDKDARLVSEKAGHRVHAEDGGVVPPSDILYRIKHGKSEFVHEWEVAARPR